MIDERRDVRRHLLAGVQAEPRRAGIDDAAHAIGTAIVEHRVTVARARPPARQRGRHFFGDDSLQVSPLHAVYRSPFIA